MVAHVERKIQAQAMEGCAWGFRALEITYNSKTDEWHPIYTQSCWSSPITSPTRVNTSTTTAGLASGAGALARITIQASMCARSRKDSEKAVAEAAKYTVKPGDWLDLDDVEGTDARVELLAKVLKTAGSPRSAG